MECRKIKTTAERGSCRPGCSDILRWPLFKAGGGNGVTLNSTCLLENKSSIECQGEEQKTTKDEIYASVVIPG